MLRKAFHGVSQSKVKKAKINIKMHIIFLGLKAKNVTINLHFVVPIFCESNTAMSYSSVLFQRDRRGKEVCASRCVSVPALTYKPVFTLKLTGIEIFPPNFSPGFLQREQSPSWAARGRTTAGTCWEGAAVRRGMSSQAFLQGCGMSHTFLLLFGCDTGLCAKWLKLVGLYFSLWKEWNALGYFWRWLMKQAEGTLYSHAVG